jgi:hypothetical protein
MELLSF